MQTLGEDATESPATLDGNLAPAMPPAPQLLQSTDPNTVAFKVDSLTCRVSSRPENAFQTLHLKIEQDPPPQVQVIWVLRELLAV